MTKVQPVRFRLDELEAAKASADAAGMTFNAWVRRACKEAADLERAVHKGDDRDPGVRQQAAVPVEAGSSQRVRNDFSPDWRPVSKKKR
jgi:hypothetical protein